MMADFPSLSLCLLALVTGCSLETDFAWSFLKSKIHGIFCILFEGKHDLDHSMSPIAIL